MKKILSILAGFVILTLSALSLESDFKNSLLKVDFVKTAADSYNIQLYTQKPYSEPIKVIKKTNTNYYLLLPETFHSVSSVTPFGDIKNVEVKLFPYAGQDLNNGYTKINIFTAKPVNIKASLKTSSGAVAPSIDTKKLAQLDSNFNSKQAQLQAQQKAAQEAAAKKAKEQAAARAAAEAQKAKQLQAQKAAQEAAQRAAAEAQKQKAIKEQQALAAQKEAARKEAALKAQQEAQRAAEAKAREHAEQKAKIAAEQKAQQQKIAQVPAAVKKPVSQQIKTTAPAVKKAPPAAVQTPKQVQKTVQKPVVSENIQIKTTPASKTIVVDTEENKQIEETTAPPAENIVDDNESVSLDDTMPQVDETVVPMPVSVIQKIKNKLSVLKPYYYVLVDNLVLTIASIIAFFGIIALILISKNNKKKALKEEPAFEDSLEDNTEESDLSVFGEIDTANNPLSGVSSNSSPMFKDELDTIEEDTASQSSVQTLEQTYQQEELDESYIEPQVLSSVEIAPHRGFMVIEQQGIKALFGYIHDDVFLIYTFREYISNSDIKFRISEKQEDKTFFIVKVDRFKLLVRVTKTNMKLELEM